MTYSIWEEFVIDKLKHPYIAGEPELWEVLIALIFSLISIPIDIILLPFEIIALIIYKIIC
jgi:hypothetical protein